MVKQFRLEEERKTKSGIAIPDNTAEKPDQGEIIAVGKGEVRSDGKVRAEAKIGHKVLFGKYSIQTREEDMEPMALNVFPLWQQDINDALTSALSTQGDAELENALGVAAVLPTQQLDLETLDSLESAGLLVIEVPESFKEMDCASITNYLQQQLEKVKDATRITSSPSIISAGASPKDYTPVNGSLNADQQRKLLRSLNDPDNAVDSFW